jgi:hypothetical protein
MTLSSYVIVAQEFQKTPAFLFGYQSMNFLKIKTEGSHKAFNIVQLLKIRVHNYAALFVEKYAFFDFNTGELTVQAAFSCKIIFSAPGVRHRIY